MSLDAETLVPHFAIDAFPSSILLGLVGVKICDLDVDPVKRIQSRSGNEL